jgi:hypothetical protein
MFIVLSHDTDRRDLRRSADADRATNSAFNQMPEELRGLSTRGVRVVAKESGHYIQQDRPEVVIKAIHEIVDQVRRKVGAGGMDR